MAYWIRGRDSQTGEPTDAFFSEADNEDAARAQATAQGMVVESVECHIEGPKPSENPRNEQKSKPGLKRRLFQLGLVILLLVIATAWVVRGWLSRQVLLLVGVIEIVEIPDPLFEKQVRESLGRSEGL